MNYTKKTKDFILVYKKTKEPVCFKDGSLIIYNDINEVLADKRSLWEDELMIMEVCEIEFTK